MSKKFIVFALLVSVVSLAGCESTGPNTKKGIGIGAVLGSVAGGVIGHQSGRGVEGAVIGGAVGAGAGALIGSGMDNTQEGNSPQVAQTSGQLSILKVIEMSKQGAPDDVIIDEIRKTGTVFDMDEQTVQYLKDNQVSDKVIGYMMTTK